MKAIFTIFFFFQLLYSACDFPISSYKGHYYGFFAEKMTWADAQAYADRYDGYLAVPNDEDENNYFLQNNWTDAWIGIYDPNQTNNYCYTYGACSTEPMRFRQHDGSPIAYTKWATDEPNNFVSAEDIDSHGRPVVSPLGEHWALMLRSGYWADYGNHGGGYDNVYKAKFIMEFNTSPNCEIALDTNETGTPSPTEPFCLPDSDGNGVADDNVDCLTTNTTGVEICPKDMTKCEPTYEEAICLSGGTLNANRDLCDKEGSIACPNEFTFDAPTDTCFKNVNCDAPMSCKTGYSLRKNSTSNNYECTRAPSYSSGNPYCESGGTLNASSNLCILPLASGYDNNSGSCFGEWTPLCDTGLSLSANVCSASPICPAGTTFNVDRNQCETVLTCPIDTVYDQGTGKCAKTVEVRDYFWLSRCKSKAHQATIVYTGKEEHEPSGRGCGRYYSPSGTIKECNEGGRKVVNGRWKNVPRVVNKCAYMPNGYYDDSTGSYGAIQNTPNPHKNSSFVVDFRINNYTRGALWGGNEQGYDSYGLRPFYRMYTSSPPAHYKTVNGWAMLRSAPTYETVYEDISCPSGYLRSGQSCLISASCPSSSTLNNVSNMCEKAFDIDCPTGSTYNAALDVCIGSVDCGVGVLDQTTQRCIIPNTINKDTCPSGYSYSGYPVSKCEAIPLCNVGSYIPNATAGPLPWNGEKNHKVWDKCYVDDNTCPHGNQYSCNPVGVFNSVNHCSPWSCIASGSGVGVDHGTPIGDADKPDDGVVDANGCQGNVYIFNGRDSRCGSWSLWAAGAGSSNCCNNKSIVAGLVKCNQKEVALAKLNEKKLCHYVGQYCSREECYPLAGCHCTQKKKTYCCYNSLLGRIIQEQARVSGQLAISWGTAEDPNCRGLTPEEFERIDFSQMDLREFEVSVAASMPPSNTSNVEYNDDRSSASSKANEIKRYGN